jgi:hypothetical protein
MPVLLSASALLGATSSTCDPVVETPALSTEQLGTAIQRTDMPKHISDAITNTHTHASPVSFSCLMSVARERLLRLVSSPRCEDNHMKTTGVRVRVRAWGAGWFPLLLFRLDPFLVWWETLMQFQ